MQNAVLQALPKCPSTVKPHCFQRFGRWPKTTPGSAPTGFAPLRRPYRTGVAPRGFIWASLGRS
eukprot:7378793-Prymnesium_polylepis.2